MPITKVPIIHKFGIISQSQRDELQERLQQKSVLHDFRTTLIPQTTRNPLELSESFIQQFNNPDSIEEKDRNEDQALKLLARIRRRAGLKDGGAGSHVDIPRAWSELSMLAQCRGKVQEECLDALIISLRQAEFSVDHIASLFYLAETTLYWLRTDAMDQPFLRIGEIKLLKMGQAVFLRLFYHHMAGHLQGRSDFKSRLLTYLSAITDGFAENEEVYSPYPGAHLSLRMIASIGKMIVGEVTLNDLNKQPDPPTPKPVEVEQPLYNPPAADVHPSSPPNSLTHTLPDVPRSTPVTEVPANKERPVPPASRSGNRQQASRSGSRQQGSQAGSRPATNQTQRSRPNTQQKLMPQQQYQQQQEQLKYQQQQQQSQPQRRPDTYTSSIHDLSPSLWHALDVWRCTVHLSSGFPQAIKALALCGTTLGSEHWVDAVCALLVISEAARGNMKVMKTMQNLAKGVIPGTSTSHPGGRSLHNAPSTAGSKTYGGRQTGEKVDFLGDDELEDSQDGMSLKGSLSDNQSIDIKLTEMLDSKMELRSEKKFSLDSDMSLGLGLGLGSKQLSNLSANSFMKSTNASVANTSVAVLIDSPQDKRAASFSDRSTCDRSTVLKGSGSSDHSIPDVLSRESQLDSAGALLADRRTYSSRSPVMEEDEDGIEDDVDSDLMPGDESEVEIRREDVTMPRFTRTTPLRETTPGDGGSALRMRREVSFDIDIIGEEVAVEAPSEEKNGMTMSQKRVFAAQQDKGKAKPSSAGSVKAGEGLRKGGKTQESGKYTPYTRRLRANMVTELDGMNGWPWEVAFVYTELMGHMSLHSDTANLQKRALIGDRLPDYDSAPALSAQRPSGLESAGLLDMAEYEKPSDEDDDMGLVEDWSWRVRYSAVMSLVKLCRCLEGDTNKEGLRTVAWNFLMRRHSKERDDRVMEAFRVGQVEAHLENEMQKCPSKYSINARLAAGLASTYLPPLAPVVDRPRRPQGNRVELPKPTEPLKKGPNRPSLRQEIQLATALKDQLGPPVRLYSRTSMDLKRIVEDQWRKELQEQLEDEEKEKKEYLEEQQVMVEERQREVAENKANKFKNSTTPLMMM